jgi:hypothetical protein
MRGVAAAAGVVVVAGREVGDAVVEEAEGRVELVRRLLRLQG